MFTFNLKDLDISQCSDELLNNIEIEVTEEIEEILQALQNEKNPNYVEEVLFDDESVYNEEYMAEADYEKELEKVIPVLEAYISASKEYNKAITKSSWPVLHEAKIDSWSRFQDEIEWPWVAFDLYNQKLDNRLSQVTPTQEQWEAARAKRLEIQNRICGFYKDSSGQWKTDYRNRSVTVDRISVTRPAYETAINATRACSEFWKTEEGKRINLLNAARREAWEAVVEAKATEMFSRYYSFVNSDLVSFYDSEALDNQDHLFQSQNELAEEYLKADTGEQEKDCSEIFLDDGTEDDIESHKHICNPRGMWNYRTEYQCKKSGRIIANNSMAKEDVDSLLSYVDSF